VECRFDCSRALGRDDYNQVWLFFSSPDAENETVGQIYYIDDLMGPPIRMPQNYTVTFSVTNKDTGGKLKDIRVMMRDEVLITNLQGEVNFNALEGTYDYLITEPGYFPVESKPETVK